MAQCVRDYFVDCVLLDKLDLYDDRVRPESQSDVGARLPWKVQVGLRGDLRGAGLAEVPGDDINRVLLCVDLKVLAPAEVVTETNQCHLQFHARA